jgi:hypothetical protein
MSPEMQETLQVYDMFRQAVYVCLTLWENGTYGAEWQRSSDEAYTSLSHLRTLYKDSRAHFSPELLTRIQRLKERLSETARLVRSRRAEEERLRKAAEEVRQAEEQEEGAWRQHLARQIREWAAQSPAAQQGREELARRRFEQQRAGARTKKCPHCPDGFVVLCPVCKGFGDGDPYSPSLCKACGGKKVLEPCDVCGRVPSWGGLSMSGGGGPAASPPMPSGRSAPSGNTRPRLPKRLPLLRPTPIATRTAVPVADRPAASGARRR